MDLRCGWAMVTVKCTIKTNEPISLGMYVCKTRHSYTDRPSLTGWPIISDSGANGEKTSHSLERTMHTAIPSQVG